MDKFLKNKKKPEANAADKSDRDGFTRLSETELNKISGGGEFDDVPTVKEHSYSSDVRKRS